MEAVKALGGSLEELRNLLDISEEGRRISLDGKDELWRFPESGLAAWLVDSRVASVFLYSDSYEGFSEFQGDTGGLRLDTSKQIVRFKFGYPSKHREGATKTVLNTAPNFDRYDYEDCSLHFQYDETGKWLRMMTIMSPDTVAKFDGPVTPESNHPIVYDKAKYHADSVQELDLPEEQAAVHTAFFLGWLMDNDLCSSEFVEDRYSNVAAYKRREITALRVYAIWDYCLVDDMLSDEGNAFAQDYFDFSVGKYIDDYAELLIRKLPSEFHVPYTWENQKKINHQISKRYSDWRRSGKAASSRSKKKRMPPVERTRTRKARPEKPPLRKRSARKAPAKASRKRRAARTAQRSSKLSWLLKFVIGPILAVAIGLAIIIFADSL